VESLQIGKTEGSLSLIQTAFLEHAHFQRHKQKEARWGFLSKDPSFLITTERNCDEEGCPNCNHGDSVYDSIPLPGNGFPAPAAGDGC
jgi:hypothetical protein